MLGTDILAQAATEAIAGLVALGGVNILVVIIGVPVLEMPLGVEAGEQIRDGNALGADLGAIPAGGAGDGILRPEDPAYLLHSGLFLLVQRLEICHIAAIIVHHIHIAHAGEHHHHAFLAGGEADGIAGIAAAAQIVKDLAGFLRQVDQTAALHRLHNDGGLAVLAADLQALVGLDGGILKVHIVQLDLHHFDLGILGEDLIQHRGLIVEGNAEMLDFALVPQLQGGLIGAALLEAGEEILVLGVHQIEVKIFHAAGGQLLVQQGANILILLKKIAGELVGEDVAFPGIAGSEAGPQGRLALAADVAMGGVEIVKAGIQEGIHHAAGLLQVHFLALHRQTHAAEAEIFLDVVKSHKVFLPVVFKHIIMLPAGEINLFCFCFFLLEKFRKYLRFAIGFLYKVWYTEEKM